MSSPSSQRLPKALVGPYRYALKHWRTLRWVGLAAFVVVLTVGGFVLYRATRPLVYTSGDLANLAWIEGQKRLEDTEARAQLTLIANRVAAQNVSEEVVLLTNTVIASLSRSYAGSVPPERDWALLEPLLEQLAVQVANGDPLAQDTIAEIIAIMSAPAAGPEGL